MRRVLAVGAAAALSLSMVSAPALANSHSNNSHSKIGPRPLVPPPPASTALQNAPVTPTPGSKPVVQPPCSDSAAGCLENFPTYDFASSLVGPYAHFYCLTLEPFSYQDLSLNIGTVYYDHDAVAGTVSASVDVAGLQPNTQYGFRIVQSGTSPCHLSEIVFTSDENGVLQGNYTEPLDPGSTAARALLVRHSYDSTSFRSEDVFTYPVE